MTKSKTYRSIVPTEYVVIFSPKSIVLQELLHIMSSKKSFAPRVMSWRAWLHNSYPVRAPMSGSSMHKWKLKLQIPVRGDKIFRFEWLNISKCMFHYSKCDNQGRTYTKCQMVRLKKMSLSYYCCNYIIDIIYTS